MYEVFFYEDERGRCQVDEFLDNIRLKERGKVEKWIEKLEREGPNLPRPFADTLRGKIRELRIRFGSNNYRFLYFFYGKAIIITHGFAKKTSKTPLREIEYSENKMTEFLKRNKKR
jgi:phage-related protein